MFNFSGHVNDIQHKSYITVCIFINETILPSSFIITCHCHIICYHKGLTVTFVKWYNLHKYTLVWVFPIKRNICIIKCISSVDRHFSAVTFFSRLGDFCQIADWYFRGRRAQTTRKFLFCSITSITCFKSRSWYFRGLDANRENRENMVTAEKWRFTV